MNSQDLIIKRALFLLDTPYIWGGKKLAKQNGLDCSGFVEDCLMSAGVLPWKAPMATFDQFDFWKKKGAIKENVADFNFPIAGTLVYYWKKNRAAICHVEIMLNSRVSIGARGNSKITSIALSRLANKGVKMRLTAGRPNAIAGYANPLI